MNRHPIDMRLQMPPNCPQQRSDCAQRRRVALRLPVGSSCPCSVTGTTGAGRRLLQKQSKPRLDYDFNLYQWTSSGLQGPSNNLKGLNLHYTVTALAGSSSSCTGSACQCHLQCVSESIRILTYDLSTCCLLDIMARVNSSSIA